MKRKRVCKCGKVFEYEIGRGRDRIYCTKQCENDYRLQRLKESADKLSICKTVGCEAKANRKGPGLCEACYARLRRKGTTDYKPIPPYKTLQSEGYVWLREPGHPLSGKGGLVYEHRYVFYEHNGGGPFKCNWCGADITWETMHVDHLDEDKSNNDISNLVASCPICNQQRSRGKFLKAQRARRKQITYRGITKSASQWASELGLSRSAFMDRIDNWSIEQAIERPHGTSGPKKKSIEGDAQ